MRILFTILFLAPLFASAQFTPATNSQFKKAKVTDSLIVTGVAVGVTPLTSDSSTRFATTQYVKQFFNPLFPAYTWQQTLTNGSTLTQNNFIQSSGYNFGLRAKEIDLYTRNSDFKAQVNLSDTGAYLKGQVLAGSQVFESGVKSTKDSATIYSFDTTRSNSLTVKHDSVYLKKSPLSSDNSTAVATTAWTNSKIAAIPTASPAGNYGNIQLNRNGQLAAAGSDSLSVNNGALNSKFPINLNGQLFAANGSNLHYLYTATNGIQFTNQANSLSLGMLSNTGNLSLIGNGTFGGTITGADANVSAATAPTYFLGASANISRRGAGILSIGNGTRDNATGTIILSKVAAGGVTTPDSSLHGSGGHFTGGLRIDNPASGRKLKAVYWDAANKNFSVADTSAGGGSFTLTNGSGTTANGSAVDLGGELTQNTSVVLSGNAFQIVGGGAGAYFEPTTGISNVGDQIGDYSNLSLTVDAPNGVGYFRNSTNVSKFGINTTTPTEALEVNGNIRTLNGSAGILTDGNNGTVQVGDIDGAVNNTRFSVYDQTQQAAITGNGVKFGVNESNPSETLDVNGGIKVSGKVLLNRVLAESDYTVTDNDYIISVRNNAVDLTVTFPSAVSWVNRIIIVKRYDSNCTGDVFITSSSNDIQDINTLSINATGTLAPAGTYGQSQTFQSNGTFWEVIN